MITSSKQWARASLWLAASLTLATLSQTQGSHHTSAPDVLEVPTSSGLVRGLRSGWGRLAVYKFLSVPYAEAPVGSLRFRKPVDLIGNASSLTLVVDATRHGKTCPQFKHLARFVSPLLNLDRKHETSEDCLRLSIYAPAAAAMTASSSSSSGSGTSDEGQRLPVIVWLPGEGFDFADERQFDGSQLAARTRSLVVSVQYRVGALGFLSEPSLNITGNMGLHDQLAALRWVQRNICAFGGEPERVTLMGRFSGSMAISSLLTAPQQSLIQMSEPNQRPRALFRRAIMLSGLAVRDWTIERAGERGTGQRRVHSIEQLALERNLCERHQLSQPGACLQALPVQQLLEVAGHGWKLAADDELVGQQDPIERVRDHANNKLALNLEAVLLGETQTEGTLCLLRHLLNQRQSRYARLLERDELTRDDLFEMLADDSATYFGLNLTRTNPIQLALETLLSSNEDGRRQGQLRAKYLDACSAFMVGSHNNRFRRHLLQLAAAAAGSNSSGSAAGREAPLQVFHYSLNYKPSFSLAPGYVQTAAHGDDVPLIFGLLHNKAQPQHNNQADLLMTEKMMSYIGNFVHGKHPLASQPAAQHAEQVHTLELREGASAGAANDQVALVSELELAKLLAAQQMVSAAAPDEQEPLAAPNSQQQFAGLQADQLATRSQRLVEFHNRQQQQQLMLLASDNPLASMLLPQRQILLAGQGQQLEPASASVQTLTSTTTTSTSTSLLGAELSLISSLIVSSCVLILALMSVCSVLSVIIVRSSLGAS